MNVSREKKSQRKSNVDRPLTEALRIWGETFAEYHFVPLEF